MYNSENETLYFLAVIRMSYSRSTIAGNVTFICDKWRIEPQSLQYRWNKDRLSVYSQQYMPDAEDVVAVVKELTDGQQGLIKTKLTRS